MVQTLDELILVQLGVRTTQRVNDQLSSVGTTAARAVIQDPNRVAFTLVNLSVNILYTGPFPNVSATRGFRLNPSGGLITVLYSEDFHLTGWEWFVIADAAASTLLTVEWLTQKHGKA